MKTIKNILNKSKILIVVSLFSLMATTTFAQGPPPPPTGDPAGSQEHKIGGNAHIGGGILILLTLGLAYGGKRFYDVKKAQKEEIA